VNIDLALFEAIVSCGKAKLRQTSMRSLPGAPLRMAGIKEGYLPRGQHGS
jgi:lipoate-protein ligase B